MLGILFPLKDIATLLLVPASLFVNLVRLDCSLALLFILPTILLINAPLLLKLILPVALQLLELLLAVSSLLLLL